MPRTTSINTMIGKYIKYYRLKAGLKVRDLCVLTGITSGHMSKIENCKTVPSPARLNKIATALNITIDDLIDGFQETSVVGIDREIMEYVSLLSTEGKETLLCLTQALLKKYT
jgi:transcriptional regulator with XRE-family HTH domain